MTYILDYFRAVALSRADDTLIAYYDDDDIIIHFNWAITSSMVVCYEFVDVEN